MASLPRPVALNRKVGGNMPMEIGQPVSAQSPGGCLRTIQAAQTTREVLLAARRCACRIDTAGLLTASAPQPNVSPNDRNVTG